MRLISSLLLLAVAALGVPPCAAMGVLENTASMSDHCAPGDQGEPALDMVHAEQPGSPACCAVSPGSRARLPIVQTESPTSVIVLVPATLPLVAHVARTGQNGPAPDSVPLRRSGPALHLQFSVFLI